MVYIDNFDDLLRSLNLTPARPLLIGIDGRPCSGKSTLVDKLAEALKAETIFLDDFFIPEEDWPKNIKPAYPFPYFRDEEFVQGIKALSQGLPFSYCPFDWFTKKLGPKKFINPESIIIVEGISVLRQELVSNYYKKSSITADGFGIYSNGQISLTVAITWLIFMGPKYRLSYESGCSPRTRSSSGFKVWHFDW